MGGRPRLPKAREAAIRGELASAEGLSVERVRHGTASGVQRIKPGPRCWDDWGAGARFEYEIRGHDLTGPRERIAAGMRVTGRQPGA